jgi:hypothetical protein
MTAVPDADMFASVSTSTKDVIADVNVPRQQVFIRGRIVLNLDSASTPHNYVRCLCRYQ